MATVANLKTKLKTINIKGTPYVEVHTRVAHFRENYKDWAIETEIQSLENGVCVMRAVIKDDKGMIKSVGTAYETEDSTFINKTSYIENCETSAVGRALGFLGIGIENGIASRDEMQNAELNQYKKQEQSICPICKKKTTKASLDNWGMCSQCKQKKAVLPPQKEGAGA